MKNTFLFTFEILYVDVSRISSVQKQNVFGVSILNAVVAEVV
jgi:hypothetical protein